MSDISRDRPTIWAENQHWKDRAEKAEARVKELEDKFERVNAVRTFALIKFGDEPVPRRVDGVLEFPTFKNLDREMMEKGDE